MNEKTVKCPLCSEPYHVYSHYAGNQSACPKCRMKADRQYIRDWVGDSRWNAASSWDNDVINRSAGPGMFLDIPNTSGGTSPAYYDWTEE